MRKTVLFAALLGLSAVSSAAMAADGQWFVRGEGGTSRLSVDGNSGNDNAFGVRGGYYFNPYIAVEGFYTNFGQQSDNGGSAKIDGYGAGVALKKDFGPDNTGWYISGRGGVLRANATAHINGLGHFSDNSTKWYVGVGTGYDFNKTFGLGVNYDYDGVDVFGSSGSIKTLTLAGEVRF